MAGAKPGVHILNLESNLVHESLLSGEKVIKWDEVGLVTDIWSVELVNISVLLFGQH